VGGVTTNPLHSIAQCACPIAVDVGNSAIKFAWRVEPSQPLRSVSLLLHDPDWVNTLTSLCAATWNSQQLGRSTLRTWLVASVNAKGLAVLKSVIAESFPDDPWCELSRHDFPLPVDLDYPDRVGIDRLIGAWAATEIAQQGTLISIDAGSAITVDLTVDYRFQGGAILPGLSLQLAALHRGTDRLPIVQLDQHAPCGLPGRNTEMAIRGGILYGIAGAIDRILSEYERELGERLPVISTGGDMALIQRFLEHAPLFQPHLLLAGILHRATQLQVK
jgi:type III pantothenate kinase